jgi:nucleotide-binding universal stress UspA family protein
MMKLLIAVDGSDLSLDAVRHALRLKSEGLQAELLLANVQEPPSLYEMITVRDPDRVADLGVSAGEHLLQAARQLCDAGGSDYAFEVALGEPAHTLIAMAERHGCDAILAGMRGKGAHGWLGSVSQELMHVSHIPVTLVKHPQPVVEAAEGEAQDEAAPRVIGWPVSSPGEPMPLQGLA